MENISLNKKEHTAVVTIDHPPANTWNLATVKAFEQVIQAVEKDPQSRAVIITGAGGKYFSAGFDVKDAANSGEISPRARGLWTRIDRFPKPVIAAINGFAIGGGLELALACHFRVLADTPGILLGLTELNLGLIPGWGGTQRLPQIVGKARALEMILFSETVTASQALAMGLVNRLVPAERFMDDALAFAADLARRPPIAVRCVLNAISEGVYEGLDQGLEAEAKGSATVRTSQDCQEGFAAFLEKRAPVFKGI